mgnify:CR=1 FL=1
MESISIRQLMVAEDQLEQIRDAIRQLQQWNASIEYFIKNIYDIVPFEKE